MLAIGLALNCFFMLAGPAAPFEKWIRALGSPLFLALSKLAAPLAKFRIGVLHARTPVRAQLESRQSLSACYAPF
jgi:hypothetical protein